MIKKWLWVLVGMMIFMGIGGFFQQSAIVPIVNNMLGYAYYTSGCQKYPAGLPVTPPSDKGDFLVNATANLLK